MLLIDATAWIIQRQSVTFTYPRGGPDGHDGAPGAGANWRSFPQLDKSSVVV